MLLQFLEPMITAHPLSLDPMEEHGGRPFGAKGPEFQNQHPELIVQPALQRFPVLI
jgi:hypothetical protein